MLKIAICDDDIKFCSRLEKMILDYGSKQNEKTIVDIYYRGDVFLERVGTVTYDMLFMDICMEPIDGIEVGKELRRRFPKTEMRITYVSTFKEYAMSLFKIRPFDFLLKPIKEQEVRGLLGELSDILHEDHQFFQYKHNHIYYKIPYYKILYFYSEQKRIHVVTREEDKTFWGKLDEVNEQTNHYFLQIHKSYLINCSYVKRYQYDQVIMENNVCLNITRPNRDEVREKLIKLMEKKK